MLVTMKSNKNEKTNISEKLDEMINAKKNENKALKKIYDDLTKKKQEKTNNK